MSNLDEYRSKLALMRLGQLVGELIDLKMSPEPEHPKAKITQVQKIKEVVEQLNRREVNDDKQPRESRRTTVRSLKSIL